MTVPPRKQKNRPEPGSEFQVDPGLLHDAICRVAGQAMLVDWERPLSDRAVPHLMVASTLPLKKASVPFQRVNNQTVKPASHLMGAGPFDGEG